MESIADRYRYWENRQLEVDRKQDMVTQQLSRLALSEQLQLDIPGITIARLIPFPIRSQGPPQSPAAA